MSKSRLFTQTAKVVAMTVGMGNAVVLTAMFEEKRREDFQRQHPGAKVESQWHPVAGTGGYFEHYVVKEAAPSKPKL